MRKVNQKCTSSHQNRAANPIERKNSNSLNQSPLKMSLKQQINALALGLMLAGLLPEGCKQAQANYFVPQQQSTQQMQSFSQQQQQQQQQSATSTFNQQQQDQLNQQPNIIPFSFNPNVQENQRAFVMCTTASGELPVSFSWLKDSQLLSPQVAQARRIQVKPDQDSSTLKISTVRLDHAGNYTCVARNRFGSHSHTAQLVVLGEPRWLKEPQAEPIVSTRGQTIVIDCQTTGYPRPQQTWQIKTHTQGDFEPLVNIVGGSGRVSLAPNGSLVIRNADKSDEANYLCKSSNGIGKGVSWSTSLKVTVPAHFEAAAKQQQPLVSVIRKSQQVQLRCDAYGDQPITIEWLKNKQPLAQQSPQQQHHSSQQQHEAGYPLMAAGDVRYSIHSNNNPLRNGLISQLLIKQAQRSDNSLYECVTRNPHGRDRLAMELVVQEEPDNIQELQLTQVSSRAATLMWNEPYDGRSPITSYMFQYKRVEGAQTAAAAAAGELMGVDFLDEQQAAEAALGGAGGHLQQTQGVNGAPAHHLKAAQDGGPGDWQHANRIVLPMGANASQTGSVKSIAIEKLEPSSRYVLRALAVNAIGQSKFSQPMEFSTDEEAPEVGPVNIRAEPLNSTSIQVSWDEIPRSRHLGRIQGYYIGYRVANNNSAAANFIYKPFIINDFVGLLVAGASVGASNSPAMSPPPSPSPSSGGALLSEQRLGSAIHDLRRDTVYEITVVAFNSRGSGPSSDFVVCKTIEMESPKPVKLAIRRESNESIFIEWQRDPADQNPVDDYVLYQEKNSASQEWLQVRLPGNQTQYKAPGLKCGTRYQFYITAHNKVGKSAPSEVVSASTSGALPVIPAKTSLIKMVNSTCLLINLNSFQDNGCRIKTFTVRYRVEKVAAAGAGATAQGSQSAEAANSVVGQQLQQQQQQQQQQLQQSANSNGISSSPSTGQLVSSNGMSASHQALTAASQLGGKTVLAGQTASSTGAHASEWIAIRPKSNLKQQQRANEEDRMEYLCELSPVGEYTIHVAATNDVGRSEIEYSVLMSSDELRHSALKEVLELFAGLPNVFAYIPSMIVFLLAGLLLSVVSLILYTTAMKYYQKFVIMQNQMRATRRAKADEKRRRKLANQSRHSQKMGAELWAEEYEAEEDELELEEEEEEDVEDERELEPEHLGAAGALNEGPRANLKKPARRLHMNRRLDMDGDDEDDTDELHSSSLSSSSCSNNSNAAIQRSRSSGAGFKQRQRAAGRALARNHSHLSHGGATLRPHNRHHAQLQQQQQQQQQRAQQHHYRQYSSSNLAPGRPAQHSHYLANIANSAFDTSSIDSPCAGKQPGSTCLSTASTDSILNGRFQCLNSKQYVKMNEYTMLPSISASLSPAAAANNNNNNNNNSDIYGARQRMQHASPQQQYRLSGTSPSGNSSSSASNNTASTTATNGNSNPSSLYYSTLRRTNMQTYLPQQRSQTTVAAAAAVAAAQRQQNMADIYGYYVAPQQQQQQNQGPVQQQQQPTTNQVRAQAQQAQVAAAAAAAAAAQQAANEAANSIFVPPQQIIYSAPNIRRQPPVFL